MKQLNEKELAVFCGFAVLGAPDPISGEVSVTFEERKALYRALRIDHFEVAKEEFAAIEAMYDQGLVTIDAAAGNLKMKKPAVQEKIYKAVYHAVKALAGGNEEKMARGDRKGALDELKEKLGLIENIHNHSADPVKKKSPVGVVFAVILILGIAAAGVWYFKFKHA